MGWLRTLAAGTRVVVGLLWRGLSRFATGVFGRCEWHAPAWLSWTSARSRRSWQYLKANPKHGAAVAAAAVAALGGLVWYITRPTPHYVTYEVTPPGLTEYNDRGISSIKPLKIVFSESAAPLLQAEKPVLTGIDMSPAIPGTWFWTTDRELNFTPKDDWPVDGDFAIRFARSGLFGERVELESYRLRVRSQPFSAEIAESQFYQDPRNPNLKKLVATVKFSHPVDIEHFEEHVTLSVAKDAEYLGLTADSRHFTVAYDRFRLSAFIHSAALGMPRDDTPMTLTLNRGVRAARGGNDTPEPLESVVIIPGRTSLRFTDARMTVVDNARYEPEQILIMTSSSPVVERALTPSVAVRLLPARHPRQSVEDKRPYQWGNPAEIGADLLAASEPVSLTYVAADEGGDTSHGFRFRAPVGRFLHVTVKDGVQGTGGYLSGKPYVSTVKVGPYHRALTFLGQGALLSLSGDKTIGFLSRDVEQVDVEIARVLPNQLQHLAPQMWDFSKPSLYEGMEDKLVERFTTTRDYSGNEPGKPTYDSIDVGEYLDASPGRRGLFLLHLRARGSLVQADAEDEDENGYEDSDDRLQDTRLVLVTDLGFIVKQAKDGSRAVFVQSIRTGSPVDGARVELLGSNGQPMLEATTDISGRALLPRPAPLEARREKTPALIVARKDTDVSFMPLNSGGRELDLSRFDTGGVDSADSPQQLSTYLFSDRGIYRPGETMHLGIITRTADWKGTLTGLPMTVEITDARGMIVGRNELKLSAASFDEVTYTSQTDAPTGTYQAVAYVVRNDRRRETLGSTSFRVQEFEPDRLKVRLDLGDQTTDAWLRPDEVRARITVAHLFGEPAGGRRVEGDLSLTPALPRFARYPQHRFQIGEALPEPYQERLAAKVTDAQGSAEFDLDLKRFVGRAFRLNVLARAFEAEGGRNVGAQTSAIVSEAPYLVGVKTDGDLSFVPRASARDAEWLAVNQELNPVAADSLTLDWVQRRYVSVLTQQSNRTFRYVSQLKELVRDSRPVAIAAGGSRFVLPTQEPGDFVLVLRNASGAELNRLSYSVAGQANLSRSLERNAELQVQLDKPAYNGGDTIEISIRAPYIGAGLITVERDRVYHYQWFKTTTTSSVQRVRLPQEFEGNGYVSVQFLRDPASDELFSSPLSYGVAAFAPDLSARTQPLQLTAPGLVKPGQTLTMRLEPSERSRVAVLAVDEGILQVARYRNPDPLGFFFQKRRLEVDTRQILDLILPDFKRFLSLAAAGGDGESGFARQLNPFSRKRKSPVAFWSGVIEVGPGGRELQYTVPDYFNGRLRIVAIAASAGRMGVAEAATEVRGDFILTPNVPAMAAPGDEFLVSVGVFNNTTGASGPIRVEAQLGPGLSIVGPGTVDLQIAEKREGVGEFRVKANPVLGSATLTFVARRGEQQAQNEETVSVRPAVAYRTQLTLGRVDGAYALAPLTREMYTERRTVEAAVSFLPLVWGRGLSVYLDNYEYSCTEQLVSKGVSALVVTSRPEFGVVRNRDQQPLDGLFAAVRGRQNDEGGLGLWASSPITAEFPTVYAAHVLIEARDRGQRIPNEVLGSLNGWLTRFASTPASSLGDGRLRAYAVYLLVRQGIKPDAAISNVEQELTRRYPQAWPTDLAAAYLASTYRLMQRNADADRIISAVPWSSQRKDPGEEIYYDGVVHDAQLLYLLSRHFPTLATAIPPAALETIGTAISGNRFSSLSAAYTLLALDAFAKTAATSGTLTITEIAKDGEQRVLPLPAGAMPTVPVAPIATRVQFSKSGPASAYYVVSESGFDRNPPPAAINQGVEIIREYVDASGAPLTRARVGEEFFVRLRLRTTARESLPQIAVVDLLPAGVEPVVELQPLTEDSSTAGVDPALFRRRAAARSLPLGVPGKSNWFPDHIDVREDRVILYGDLTKDAGTFLYRVRANSAGTFQIPPAFAEGMYNRTVAGLSLGGKLEVIKP
jgi:alpha-2-macroglobulin